MDIEENQLTSRRHAALQVGTLHAALLDRLMRTLGRNPESATPRDIYDALSLAVHEELTLRWLATQRRVVNARVKRVCYLSGEYLPGRSLLNALSNLDGGLVQEAAAALRSMGHDLDAIAAQEPDPGLGNGGLGRLASCFLDSLATLHYPAVGYGLRYDYGVFTQMIGNDGGQQEVASSWLKLRNVWEAQQGSARHVVHFGGRSEPVGGDDDVAQVHRWVGTEDLYAVGFDQLIPGNGGPTVNNLRLWSGRAITPFRIEAFNAGDYADAVRDQIEAKNLSRVLYPDDRTAQGRLLRFKQQYFFVSASLQDILATHLREGRALADLAESVALQLNDVHPAIAVAELMRLLVDEHGLVWAQAWDITTRVCSYTNHSLLPETAANWPVSLFERLLPRHLQIIQAIDRDLARRLARDLPGDDARLGTMAIIAAGVVRAAHLAIIGSHRVNGVARLHSELMQHVVFREFAQVFPDRFTNVTNGISVRRWLKQSNPGLTEMFTEHLGRGWENDLEEIGRLADAARDTGFVRRFAAIKRDNKLRLAQEIMRRVGREVDADSLFDVQVKRIHEYKRQLLNLLHVASRFLTLRDAPSLDPVPRTVMFAGKAAPGHLMAKATIKLINTVARRIDAEPLLRGRLQVLFLPDYDVSLAQKIMPAADLSEQISTAGSEASGTGNMKLALNGALTIGTLDGANIEIRDRVGAENIFIFGLDAAEVAACRARGYEPRAFAAADAMLARALEFIEALSAEGAAVVARLLSPQEPYLVLADYAAYVQAQRQVDERYRHADDWSRSAASNCLNMGYFSSDRSVREYADHIWHVSPVI
jgi:starch phosphorylase